MKENFWETLPKPFFVLAPMEDVTDVVFRHVVAKAARPDVFFTEFTNSEGFNDKRGKEHTNKRLAYTKDEQPLVAHIWGDKPESFEEMSYELKKMGFKGIDINMGCPAPNVFKHGRGAGLILRPERAKALIIAAKASGLPVSVKTRLGHSKVEEWESWLGFLLKQDIANLTVHLRTKTEMSNVDAHWELIPKIKDLRDTLAPNTRLTINGDIKDVEMGLKLAEKYDIDGVMIGRGIFSNLFAFEKESKEHSTEEYFDLLRYHLELFDRFRDELKSSFKPLRRFFKIYIRDFKGAHNLRQALIQSNSTSEVRKLLNKAQENL